MTRYQALRRIGCGPISAGLVAFLNFMVDAPPNEIRFMHVTIEFDPKEQA